MAIYKGQLFVGTMDYSYTVLDSQDLKHIPQKDWVASKDVPPAFSGPEEYGADLWRFPSPESAAVPVSRAGLGNFTNYGFRTMVVDEQSGLYIGTANPANLAQDPLGNPIGGWELIKLSEE